MSDAKMLSDLFANANGEVVLNAQTYTIDEGIIITAASKGLKIRGASMGTTILKCAGTNGYGIWYQNTNPTQADYGVDISDLTILDTSGTGAVDSLLRLTQFNDFRINRVNLSHAKGRSYSNGTISVTLGSNVVHGVGTSWTSKMAPGILWVHGYPQEVLSVQSATSLTLCTNWTQPSYTSTTYALDSGGVGLHLEGTSVNGCSQYGSVENIKGFGNRIGVFCQGRPTGGAGVSAVRLVGGRMGGFAGQRIPNSIGAWFGSHTDTCEWDVPVNNVTFGAVIENGHQHSIINRAENDAPFCTITTIGGASQAPTKGIYVNGTPGGTCFGNYLFPKSVYGFGNGIEVAPIIAKGVSYDMRRSPYGNFNPVVGM